MNKTLRALLVAAACLLPTLGLAATVSLIAPADGSSYTAPASVLLAAEATDSSVTSVEFYNGATLIGAGAATPSIAGYTLTWSNVAAGSYSLTAKATDYWGVVTTTAPVTITVNPPPNVAPTVSLSTPATGSTFVSGEAIVITANAADSDGSIASVAFHANGTLLSTSTGTPYKLTTSLAAGSYSLTAVATDDQGVATTSAPVSITVTPAPNVPPSVSLTAPTAGSSYTAPASMTLAASAADSDGSIVAVEFYNGATLIGSGTLSGGSYTFAWSNVAAGSYSLSARATDNQGASADSTPVAVTVNDPPPPPVAAGVYYVYADHLNTPRVITDGSNKIVWRWDSDPFGADAANEDPDGDGVKFSYNLRFPGQYYDRETGLHYNYFRDYDPATGRYVEFDLIGLRGGLNPYLYANAAPTMFTDPLGLWSIGFELYGGIGGGINASYSNGTLELTGRVGVGLGGGFGYEPQGEPSPHSKKCGSGHIARTTLNLQAGVGGPFGVGGSFTAASGNAVTTKVGGGYSSVSKTGLSVDNSKGFGARLGGSVGVDIGSYSNWGDQQCGCR